jgi:hypothetical protein
MKLGAEPRKVGIFAALIAVAGIVYWMNSSSDAPPAPAAARPSADGAAITPVNAPSAGDTPGKAVRKRVVGGHAGLTDWQPHLPDAVDPGKVDPTLRLDLLAKVQAVEVEGGTRNLFQFCVECAALEKAMQEAKLAPVPAVSKITVNGQDVKPKDPTPPPPPTPQPAGPPPTPTINLKYYGYSTKYSDGEKKAFFLDGDDVIVAAEGEIIKKQYKIVRIGVNSVQMEDTASKSTQTLPMQQEAPV